MFSAMLLAALILAVGTEISERVRVRQEEWILQHLPESEAVAYYELLKARVRKVRILRGLVLLAMVIVALSVKRIMLARTFD